MLKLRYFFSGFLIFGIISCTNVLSVHPLGDAPCPLIPEEWDGIWHSDEMAMTLKVTDRTKGLIDVAWIEEKSGVLDMETFHCEVRHGPKWMYLNVKDDDQPDIKAYLWGRIKKEGSTLMFWLPESNRFKQAVDQGTLAARPARTKTDEKTETQKTSGDIILSDPSTKITGLIESHGAEYFEWDRPLVLFKLG
jgi:hypothetical protein